MQVNRPFAILRMFHASEVQNKCRSSTGQVLSVQGKRVNFRETFQAWQSETIVQVGIVSRDMINHADVFNLSACFACFHGVLGGGDDSGKRHVVDPVCIDHVLILCERVGDWIGLLRGQHGAARGGNLGKSRHVHVLNHRNWLCMCLLSGSFALWVEHGTFAGCVALSFALLPTLSIRAFGRPRSVPTVSVMIPRPLVIPHGRLGDGVRPSFSTSVLHRDYDNSLSWKQMRM